MIEQNAAQLVEQINTYLVPPHLDGRHGPFCPGDDHYCPEGGCSKGKCARHDPEVISKVKTAYALFHKAAAALDGEQGQIGDLLSIKS